MDQLTMRKKFGVHEYPNTHVFFSDLKLMTRNCSHFNPPTSTPVNPAGIEL